MVLRDGYGMRMWCELRGFKAKEERVCLCLSLSLSLSARVCALGVKSKHVCCAFIQLLLLRHVYSSLA